MMPEWRKGEAGRRAPAPIGWKRLFGSRVSWLFVNLGATKERRKEAESEPEERRQHPQMSVGDETRGLTRQIQQCES